MVLSKSLTNKSWAVATLLTIFIFVSFLIGTNLYFDHYQVFNFGWSAKTPINSNQRFNKIDYLNKNVGQYNAFILGSSRIGHYPTDYLNEVSGKNYYNLSLFSGIPADYLKVMKHLVKNGHPIDQVIIGLDLYPLFLPPDLDKPDFRHHPDISGKNKLEFFLDYLFQTSFVYLMTEYGYYFGEDSGIYRHDYNTGRYYPLRAMKDHKEDPSGFWEKEIGSAEKKREHFRLSEHKINAQQERDIIELIGWLETENINYKIFIHPRHSYQNSFYKNQEIDLLSNLLKFGASNNYFEIEIDRRLLNDNNNFFDLMHYKPVVAKKVIDNLFSR